MTEPQRSQDGSMSTVEPDDPANAQHWIEVFGVTVEQLQEAVAAVGAEPARVREHLLHQGGSAGVG